MGISQLGGSSGGTRLVTKQNTAGQSFSTVASISVPSGGTSNWVTVIASTAADVLVTGVGFYFDNGAGVGTSVVTTIEIAFGGAGAENPVSKVFLASGNASSNWIPTGWSDLVVPPRIASGQRVAVRVGQPAAWGSGNATVWLGSVPYASVEGN